MIVVSNSSPLIGLSAIGRIDLLKSLYQKIYVPEDVYEEAGESGEQRTRADEIKNATWIEKRKVEKLKTESVLLIIDDLRARKFAQSRNLPIIGILGILLAAKSQNLIADIKNPLDNLIAFGYWISPNLYQKILEAAGE